MLFGFSMFTDGSSCMIDRIDHRYAILQLGYSFLSYGHRRLSKPVTCLYLPTRWTIYSHPLCYADEFV